MAQHHPRQIPRPRPDRKDRLATTYLARDQARNETVIKSSGPSTERVLHSSHVFVPPQENWRGLPLRRLYGQVRLIRFGVAASLNLSQLIAGGKVEQDVCDAPELASGMEVDSRADLYSLGVVLFELLTDRQPATGGDVSEVQRRPSRLQPRRPAGCLSSSTPVLTPRPGELTTRFRLLAPVALTLDRSPTAIPTISCLSGPRIARGLPSTATAACGLCVPMAQVPTCWRRARRNSVLCRWHGHRIANRLHW